MSLLGLGASLLGGTLIDKLGLGTSRAKVGKMQTYTPEQSQLLQQMLGSMPQQVPFSSQSPLYGQSMGLLQQMLSGQPDQNLEAPIMQQYQRNVLPMIGERFSGSKGSSALNQALSSSAQDLMQNLASMRSQRQMGALGQAMGWAQLPFNEYSQMAGLSLGQRPFQYYDKPAQPTFLQGMLGNFSGEFMKGMGDDLYKRFNPTPQA